LSNDLVKIVFVLPEAEWHSASVESVWAKLVGPDQYQLENTPFYAAGLSYSDVVFAPMSEEDGRPVFKSVVRKSGHSTYLLWVNGALDGDIDFEVIWKQLADIGCSFEGFGENMLAVDVPAATDINKAYSLFELGLEKGVWDFQEQDIGHAL